MQHINAQSMPAHTVWSSRSTRRMEIVVAWWKTDGATSGRWPHIEAIKIDCQHFKAIIPARAHTDHGPPGLQQNFPRSSTKEPHVQHRSSIGLRAIASSKSSENTLSSSMVHALLLILLLSTV